MFDDFLIPGKSFEEHCLQAFSKTSNQPLVLSEMNRNEWFIMVYHVFSTENRETLAWEKPARHPSRTRVLLRDIFIFLKELHPFLGAWWFQPTPLKNKNRTNQLGLKNQFPTDLKVINITLGTFTW
jgi:hypothetical protein